MDKTTTLACPVCKKPFCGEPECPRCGSDLSELMQLIARSYDLRSQARNALMARRYGEAAHFAGQAQKLHKTDVGKKMLATAEALSMVSVRESVGS